MPQFVLCPKCSKKLQIRDDNGDNKVRCPICKDVFRPSSAHLDHFTNLAEAPPPPVRNIWEEVSKDLQRTQNANQNDTSRSNWDSYSDGKKPHDESSSKRNLENDSSKYIREILEKARNDEDPSAPIGKTGDSHPLSSMGFLFIAMSIIGMLLPFVGFELVRFRRIGPFGGGIVGCVGCVSLMLGYTLRNEAAKGFAYGGTALIPILIGTIYWFQVPNEEDNDGLIRTANRKSQNAADSRSSSSNTNSSQSTSNANEVQRTRINQEKLAKSIQWNLRVAQRRSTLISVANHDFDPKRISRKTDRFKKPTFILAKGTSEPMIGIDFQFDDSLQTMNHLIPVYAATEQYREIGEQGFGVNSLQIAFHDKQIKALRVTYRKVSGLKLTGEVVFGQWFGEQPLDQQYEETPLTSDIAIGIAESFENSYALVAP